MSNHSPSKTSLASALFEYDEQGEDSQLAALLGAEIAARFGPRDEAPLAIIARGDDSSLLGGLNGVTHWRWLYVRHLWVAEAARGAGLGRALLERAETAAKERSAVGAYIDTFDEGAARFYERCGFARHGRIEDFPVGFARVFLAKRF